MKKIFLTILLLFACLLFIFSYNRERIMHNEKINLEIIKLIPEMYNSNPALSDKIFDDNCIHHTNGVKDEGKGPDVIKNSLAVIGKQFYDSKTTFMEIVSDGDTVAVRWVWEAINILEKKKWTFNGNTIFHLKNGKIIEYWAIDDRMREMMAHGFTLSPPQK